MNVEMSRPKSRRYSRCRFWRGMPAIEPILTLLLTLNYLKDFNDRVVLETLLLNEQSRKDCN